MPWYTCMHTSVYACNGNDYDYKTKWPLNDHATFLKNVVCMSNLRMPQIIIITIIVINSIYNAQGRTDWWICIRRGECEDGSI